MRDFKNFQKPKKRAAIIFTLTAVLGSAFYLGGSGNPDRLNAFSASDFESTTQPPSIIILNPDETTTTDEPVDIFNPGETTTLREGIGIIGDVTTTLSDGISIIGEETTTTLRDGIVTVSGSETEPPSVSSDTTNTPDIGTDEPIVTDGPPALVLTYYTFNLTAGQEAQIYWKVENSIVNNYVEIFSSDNPSVASVSETGVITAHAAGTANITVKWGDLSASAVVTVTEAAVTPLVTAPPVTLPTASEPPAEPVTDPVSENESADISDTAETASGEQLPKVKLDGCLYDTKGEAVSSVTLTAGGKTAITDINGFFTFYDLDIGGNVISVVGNERLACTVSLSSDTTVFLIYNGEAIECHSSYEEMANRFVINKINIEEPNKRVYAGDMLSFYYEYEPREASVIHTQYLSSDESVAQIDENGVINAIAEGETVITVILNDGQAQSTFTLTVNPKETGKYSGLIAAGETFLILLVIGAAFIVYKRYKKKMAGTEDDDEE